MIPIEEGLAEDLDVKLRLTSSQSIPSTSNGSNGLSSKGQNSLAADLEASLEAERIVDKDEELARFRNEWREEVLHRKKRQGSNDLPRLTPEQRHSQKGEITNVLTNQRDPDERIPENNVVKNNEVGERDSLSALIEALSNNGETNRDLSRVQFEAEDEEQPVFLARLPDEILLYIISFIAEPRGLRGAKIIRTANNVIPSQSLPTGNVVDTNQKESKISTDPTSEERRHVKSDSIDSEANGVHTRSNEVTQISSKKGVVGVGVILAGPDYVSVEKLARTCWKFRQLTRTWGVWKMIVHETFYPPQIPKKLSIQSLVVEKYRNDWRTLFIEQPRVRMNGAYIASYQYTQTGLHEENVWVKVLHVVEFYRSIRFLPDGRALTFLTTDPPQETIRKMDPGFSAKGFAIGHWTMHPDGLADDEILGRPKGAKIVIEDLKDKSLSRYNFRLILKLDGRKRGKWDRMEMLEYESINLVSGEICPFPMNHKKPFHFSTVRSYGI